MWGGTFEYPAHELRASYDGGKVLGGEVFEVYEGDLESTQFDTPPPPLTIPSTEATQARAPDDRCGLATTVTYDLTVLDPGTYTVVHRRASGTGDRLNCTGRCPWTTFDGEEALVMTLVLTDLDATQ